jgi:predicted acylesterase/phospholipase RssA
MHRQLRTYKTEPKFPQIHDYTAIDDPTKIHDLSRITIWQAARATSAAPTYFERLTVGDDQFVDGGLGYNNPVQL